MDNPESQETLGKRHTTKTNNTKDTTQKTKRMSNMDPNKENTIVNPGRIREG